MVSIPAASSNRSASAWIRPLGLVPGGFSGIRRPRSRGSCIGSRYRLFLRTSFLPLHRRMRSCARSLIRSEKLQNNGKFVEPINTDLRRSKRHTGTVTFVKHPIGRLTTKPMTLLRVDALQILAASERCDLKRSSKKGMPWICNCRTSKTVCRMSRVGLVLSGRRRALR